MFKMKLTKLLSVVPFFETKSVIDSIDISRIEVDSRSVSKGSLFICIAGFTVDGHEFVEQAIENGASAIIAEKTIESSVPTIIVPNTSRAAAMISATFYHHPTKRLPLIGVTGTNGKTTVTYLLESIFNQFKKKTGVIGTIQMKIGGETYPVKNTTPDALSLQKIFNQMTNEHVDQALMEVSSHALDLGRVSGCDFDIAVFTNLSQDHLDYHNNMDDYLHAKSLLFSQLGNTFNDGQKKFAVINQDDVSAEVLKRSTVQHVLTYGCETKSQVMATAINLEVAKTTFTLETPIGSTNVTSKLIGMFNVYNMLAASSAAIAANVPLPIIKQAMESIKGVSGRFELVEGDHPFAVIVDYAHTPDSLENVLQTISDFAKKNVYVVVGCGGDRDKTKRPLMAAMALKYADHMVVTSDNPRTEDPQTILEDMTESLSSNCYEVIESRRDAIFHVIDMAEKDDVILIAGKGHETYQEINKTRYDFDDRKVAKEAIESKGTC